MKIAIEGCAHGELDTIYEALQHLEKENHVKIDLLIICGDFQAVRNPADLECMAVPPKYRKLNTFYKYYSGAKVAPVLTVFIGGNHEASNYLSELPYGGWVCPNIYYLGFANVINICGLRIAGLSGIYKSCDYLKGHFEYPPYDESSKKSAYHVRNIDVFRLKQISKPIDIFISHDWPTGIYNYGNKDDLLRWKPFFKDEMNNNKLGSKPAEELLKHLKPSYWFAAHLHCKFAAIVPHDTNGKISFTKFLALDKCLPRRKFLQIVDIESTDGSPSIEYDAEWLSVLRSTNHLLSISRRNNFMPGVGCSERWNFIPSADEIENVHQLFNENLKVPQNFSTTAPTYNPSEPQNIKLKPYINSQTEHFCSILNITDPLVASLNKSNESISISQFSNVVLDVSSSTMSSLNPDEILISDEDEDDEKSNTDFNISKTDDFFIDKVRSNFPDFSQMCSTPKSINIKCNFPEIKEENLLLNDGDKNNCENVENPQKKFKRRNWSLYSNED